MVTLETVVNNDGPFTGLKLVTLAYEVAWELRNKQATGRSYALGLRSVLHTGDRVLGLMEKESPHRQLSSEAAFFRDIEDYGKVLYFAATKKEFDDDIAAIARAYGVVYKEHSDDKIDSVPVIYRLTLNTVAVRLPGKKYGENNEEGRVNLLTANLASYRTSVTLDELMNRSLYCRDTDRKKVFIEEWIAEVE